MTADDRVAAALARAKSDDWSLEVPLAEDRAVLAAEVERVKTDRNERLARVARILLEANNRTERCSGRGRAAAGGAGRAAGRAGVGEHTVTSKRKPAGIVAAEFPAGPGLPGTWWAAWWVDRKGAPISKRAYWVGKTEEIARSWAAKHPSGMREDR